jgi:DNA-3-methyladenine glycosylase
LQARVDPSRRPLPRSFYRRPAPEIAPDLLGRFLVRRLPGVVLVARIVEVEAYQEDDPASHSYRGPTARTEVMFGPPGHLYVYFSYGNHWCMNVVTGRTGEGSAVLLRAAEPLEGLEWMRAARGVEPLRSLCSGPGKLAQALGVTNEQNRLDLVLGEGLYLSAGEPLASGGIEVGPRVGISVATEQLWRFYERESPFVSRAASSRRQARAKTRVRATATGMGKGKVTESGRASAKATVKARASAKARVRARASAKAKG